MLLTIMSKTNKLTKVNISFLILNVIIAKYYKMKYLIIVI